MAKLAEGAMPLVGVVGNEIDVIVDLIIISRQGRGDGAMTEAG